MNHWYWKLLGFGTFLCFLGMYLGTTCLSVGSSLMLTLGFPLLFLERKQLFNHPLFKPFCAFVLAVTASIIFAEPFPFFKPFFKLRYFLCVFISGLVFSRFPVLRKAILGTVICIPIFLAPIAILQRLGMNHFIHSIFNIHSVEHATGFLTHHSAFGLSMVYAFLLLFTQIQRESPKPFKWLIRFACFLCIVSVFLSFSRGAFVAFMVSFGVAFFGGKLSFQRFAVGFTVLLAIAIPVFLNSSLKDRFTNFDKARFTDRIELLSFAWDEFRKNPFLGHGFGRFGIELAKYPERQQRASDHGHAHNVFLDLASGAGLLGLASFLWFTSVVFKELLRRQKALRSQSWNLSLIGIWCAFLTGGLFDEFLLWNQIIIPTLTLLGSTFEWKTETPQISN